MLLAEKPTTTHLLSFIAGREEARPTDVFYRAESLGLGKRPTKMTCDIASQLFETADPLYVGLEYLSGVLLSKKKTYNSKSGSDVTVLQGRHVGQWDSHLFVAYPEAKDLETFHKATKQFSSGLGPGYFYPGSIGKTEFNISDNRIHVTYLQSSVKFKEALGTGIFPDNFKRAYSSWAGCLIASVFEKAISLGITEITFPENKIISDMLQSTKLEELASKFGFNKSSQRPKEGYILFVKVNSLKKK